MQTRRIIKPGQPGTKKLIKEFGDRILCVRYRYDEVQGVRLKTVELVIEEKPWKPDRSKISGRKIVGLQIDINETGIRQRIKQAGGKWNRSKKVWELPYSRIVELGLTDRIID
jgi:hypothetical protein